MMTLREAVTEYLALRRGLGYKLRGPALALRSFVQFMETEGGTHISTDLAVRWAKLPAVARPATWADRLGTVRRFAVWYSAKDPATDVPPAGLLTGRFRRKPPHIYTDREIQDLVVAARELHSYRGLRGPTCSTLFGLLSVTGMRMSEGIALDREDVDLDVRLLHVRRTKFGKSRLVPLHESTSRVLAEYAKLRDRTISRPPTPAFFLGDGGRRITEWALRYNFARVSQQIGLRAPSEGYRHGKGPRLHDMRHGFAARTLVDWYRAGLDVEREIPKLATYLGHVHVNETYWYIEAVPDLLALASERILEARP